MALGKSQEQLSPNPGLLFEPYVDWFFKPYIKQKIKINLTSLCMSGDLTPGFPESLALRHAVESCFACSDWLVSLLPFARPLALAQPTLCPPWASKD